MAVERRATGATGTPRAYDVVVVGLGGMGSAAAYHLAARGRRVLGLDRFTPPHDRGSSHGISRVIRQAYFEHPAYVPLLLRAYELWDRLARETGRELIVRTGGLMIGSSDAVVVTGSLRSAREHGLAHDLLDAAELRRRFPPFRPRPGEVAVYEAAAGYVLAEETVRAHLQRAAALGADLRVEEPVLAWRASEDGVEVTTPAATYRAEHLVLTAGPWAPQLLQLPLPLRVTRQVLCWFDPAGGVEPFLPDRFPIFAWELEDGRMIYGLPALEGPDGGVKVAFHVLGETCSPDTVNRTVSEEEVGALRACLRERIPSLAEGRLLRAVTCLYTNTPDGHFVIGLHPAHPQVAIAAGFSGHGYKFCSVVGEILADLATEGVTAHPIALFDPRRFAGA